jgi:hypothetical protein
VEKSSRRRFARYVHVKNWNLLFFCSNNAKSENAMLWQIHQNRKLSSRISLQNRLFCLCRLPAVSIVIQQYLGVRKVSLMTLGSKSENAMLWQMLSRLETCIVYCCIWTVTLAKSIVPRKTWRRLWHSYISKHSLILHYSSSKKANFNFWHVHTLRSVFVNSSPPKSEVILTNFFAEPTVLLVPITSREYSTSHEKHDEDCDTLTFLSCSWQRCMLNFQYFFIVGV